MIKYSKSSFKRLIVSLLYITLIKIFVLKSSQDKYAMCILLDAHDKDEVNDIFNRIVKGTSI